MPDLKITSLPITGYAGKTVPNRFFRQGEAARTLAAPILAVLFPGLNYTCDMPLLFYPLKLLLARGAEVLQVRADYTVPAYRSLPPEERAAWLAADASAVVQAARLQGEYARLVLVGKSIGTIALASLVSLEPQAITIWLTPLLRNPLVTAAAEQNRGCGAVRRRDCRRSLRCRRTQAHPGSHAGRGRIDRGRRPQPGNRGGFLCLAARPGAGDAGYRRVSWIARGFSELGYGSIAGHPHQLQ